MRRAFALLAVLVVQSVPLAAQETFSSDEPFPGYRNPTTSALFGFLLPGAGQMYAGRLAKGLALTGVSAIAVGIGATGVTKEKCFDTIYRFNGEVLMPGFCRPGNRTSLYGGAAVAGALWLYGIVAAPSDAERTNARILRKRRVTGFVDPRSSGTTVGLALHY